MIKSELNSSQSLTHCSYQTIIGFRFKRIPSFLHLHLFLNRKSPWGKTDDFTTSCLRFRVFSGVLWDLAKSTPVHSLMLSSNLFFCLPCLLPSFTVPRKTVLARPDEKETRPNHCSLRLFTMVRSSCGSAACGILTWTSSLVTWSLCETRSILR